MFSLKKKIILITPPKTGSTSIISAWQKYGNFEVVPQGNTFEIVENQANYNALSWRQFCNAHEPAEEPIFRKHACLRSYDSHRLKKYKIFGCVRNPWERAVSHWLWDKKYRIVNGNMTFEKWLNRANEWSYKPQINWFRSKFVPIESIHFIRFENLQNDFNKACDIINVPRTKLAVKNANKHKPYYDYYTLETREMVSKIYKRDIQLFNYKFRPPGV